MAVKRKRPELTLTPDEVTFCRVALVNEAAKIPAGLSLNGRLQRLIVKLGEHYDALNDYLEG